MSLSFSLSVSPEVCLLLFPKNQLSASLTVFRFLEVEDGGLEFRSKSHEQGEYLGGPPALHAAAGRVFIEQV